MESIFRNWWCGTAGEVALGVFVIVFVNILVLAIYASRYKRVPPNKAMVVYGRRSTSGKGYMVITGGGKFITPIIEAYELLSLEPFTFSRDIESVVADVADTEPPIIRVHAEGIARISDEVELLRRAASMLLRKPVQEIRQIVEATVEGHTRAAVASQRWGTGDAHIVEEVRPRVSEDLGKLGIVLVGDLVIRQGDPVKDVPGVSAQRFVGDIESLKQRVRRLEEHLGMERMETRPSPE